MERLRVRCAPTNPDILLWGIHTMRITMKENRFLLSMFILASLFACSGNGSGSSDTETAEYTSFQGDVIRANDYTNRDVTKVYTFKETVVDSTGENSNQSENTIRYRYTHVANIPSKYSYSGSIPGPYIVETVELNGTGIAFTYFSSLSIIISDDTMVYTNIDHSSSSGDMPSYWTLGTVYSQTSTEDLFNSDSGIHVGIRSSEYTFEAIGIENITVPAGNFEAVKTQETSVITNNFVGGTEMITSTWFFWYGKNVGFVRKVSNTTYVITAGSYTETFTTTATE
ncbi:MAG: hypothetical protein RRA35_12875, partial [Desulfomonilia bacterium]|nr:hypothetical protein [Desulfomonilia bacterium]